MVLGQDMRVVLGGFGVPPSLRSNLTSFGSVEAETVALFTNVSFDLTDRVEFEGGVRYNNESKKLAFGQDGISVLDLPTVPTYQ